MSLLIKALKQAEHRHQEALRQASAALAHGDGDDADGPSGPLHGPIVEEAGGADAPVGTPVAAAAGGERDAGAAGPGAAVAAATDAGASEAGASGAVESAVVADAGGSDAGASDAGASEAGASDAGASDAGASDPGASIAGTAGAGERPALELVDGPALAAGEPAATGDGSGGRPFDEADPVVAAVNDAAAAIDPPPDTRPRGSLLAGLLPARVEPSALDALPDGRPDVAAGDPRTTASGTPAGAGSGRPVRAPPVTGTRSPSLRTVSARLRESPRLVVAAVLGVATASVTAWLVNEAMPGAPPPTLAAAPGSLPPPGALPSPTAGPGPGTDRAPAADGDAAPSSAALGRSTTAASGGTALPSTETPAASATDRPLASGPGRRVATATDRPVGASPARSPTAAPLPRGPAEPREAVERTPRAESSRPASAATASPASAAAPATAPRREPSRAPGPGPAAGPGTPIGAPAVAPAPRRADPRSGRTTADAAAGRRPDVRPDTGPEPAAGVGPRLTRTTPPAERIEQLLASAWTAAAGRRTGEARRAYEQVLALDRNNVDALVGLAHLTAQGGDAAAAERAWRRVLDVDPNDPVARAAMVALLGASDAGSQESQLRGLIARDASDASLHFALGNVLAAQGRWADAQQSFFAAHAGDPEQPDYLYNLAVSLERLRQPQAALPLYRRALQAAAARPARFDAEVARGRIAALGAPPPSAAVDATAREPGPRRAATADVADVAGVGDAPDAAVLGGAQ